MAQPDRVAVAQPEATLGNRAAVDGGFVRARRRMVERDLVTRGVRDARVLAAMAAVPRERFVDPHHAAEAYADRPLPIGSGQTISQPLIVAMMAEALTLGPTDRVLEVGTGSGYAAAVLSLLAAEVHTVERHADLAEPAARRLAELGYRRVHVHTGDGTQGWPPAAPYDAVLVSAGAAHLPEPLVDSTGGGGAARRAPRQRRGLAAAVPPAPAEAGPLGPRRPRRRPLRPARGRRPRAPGRARGGDGALELTFGHALAAGQHR